MLVLPTKAFWLNVQQFLNNKKGFASAILIFLGFGIMVAVLVSFYLISQRQSKNDSNLPTETQKNTLEEQQVMSPVPETQFKEQIVLPTAAMCGVINDIWTLDFDQLQKPCELSLVREIDDNFLELKYIRDNNIALETALVTFAIPSDVDLSKVESIDLNLENVFCNGSISIMYSSSEGYKKWSKFKNSADFYNCGQGGSDIKNIKSITIQPDIINNQVKVVFTPYASVHPFSIDKISLVLKQRLN